jgi:hypothetical protein
MTASVNLIKRSMSYLKVTKENNMCTKSLVWIVMICHVVMLGLLHEETKDVKRNIASFITKE